MKKIAISSFCLSTPCCWSALRSFSQSWCGHFLAASHSCVMFCVFGIFEKQAIQSKYLILLWRHSWAWSCCDMNVYFHFLIWRTDFIQLLGLPAWIHTLASPLTGNFGLVTCALYMGFLIYLAQLQGSCPAGSWTEHPLSVIFPTVIFRHASC